MFVCFWELLFAVVEHSQLKVDVLQKLRVLKGVEVVPPVCLQQVFLCECAPATAQIGLTQPVIRLYQAHTLHSLSSHLQTNRLKKISYCLRGQLPQQQNVAKQRKGLEFQEERPYFFVEFDRLFQELLAFGVISLLAKVLPHFEQQLAFRLRSYVLLPESLLNFGYFFLPNSFSWLLIGHELSSHHHCCLTSRKCRIALVLNIFILICKTFFLLAIFEAIAVIEIVFLTRLFVHRGTLLQLRPQFFLQLIFCWGCGVGENIVVFWCDDGYYLCVKGLFVEFESMCLFEVDGLLPLEQGELTLLQLLALFNRHRGQLYLEGRVLGVHAQGVYAGFARE